MNLAQAIQAAYDADMAHDAAIKAAGNIAQWHRCVPYPMHLLEAMRNTYRAKRVADKAMNAAFTESRRVAS